MIKQATSTDYLRLFDLVYNQGFQIPCSLDYSFQDGGAIQTDFASVVRRRDNISVFVRGMTYFDCDPYMINDNFPTVESMFLHDCAKYNLVWFDTFQGES